MHSKHFLLPLLIMALCPCVVRASEVAESRRSVLLVNHSGEPDWQDMAYLTAVPAAWKANGGNAPVIAIDGSKPVPLEVEDYLARYKPAQVHHLGAAPLATTSKSGTMRELAASSADAAGVVLASTFWSSSPRVVVCNENDYASGLMASTLAARLGVPLLTCGVNGLSPQASATIQKLKAKELIFVGKAPAGLKATELNDLRAVMGWMRNEKLNTDYLALVNVRDRATTTVRKLSLAAPVLAAARNGMVVPLDLDIQWRTPCSGKVIKEGLPKGILAGKKPPKQGLVDLPEGKVPFVLSFGASGRDHRLHLDLNGDGAFDGAGEGPFHKSFKLTLFGKLRSFDFGKRHGRRHDLTVSTGQAEDICIQLRKLYAEVGTPRYLCIVGFPDAIPQAILPHKSKDMTSDLPYGNTDDDLFSEIAVGRVIGESAVFATLHASRVVTYDSLLDPEWSNNAGQARWENTMMNHFENVGLDASATHDLKDLKWVEKPSEGKKGKRAKSFDQDSPLTRVSFLTHMAHSWWKDIGQTYNMDSTVLLAPTVIESGGCLTCTLDDEPGLRSVISRFFRNGAVSFVGQTRPGIAQQEQQREQFWNGVLAGNSIGEAYRDAQNSMTVTVLETNQTKGGGDYYQLHIRSLFGDPAFQPHIPSSPRSEPARVEMNGNIVSLHAPRTWWKVRMRVPEDWKQWADKPLYVIRGAGAYPHRHWCSEQYDREETYANAEFTTTRRVKSITQVQTPPQPLGWSGKHTVDENQDGSRTYRWRVRLVDFDQTTGKITKQLDRYDYRIEFEKSLPKSVGQAP